MYITYRLTEIKATIFLPFLDFAESNRSNEYLNKVTRREHGRCKLKVSYAKVFSFFSFFAHVVDESKEFQLNNLKYRVLIDLKGGLDRRIVSWRSIRYGPKPNVFPFRFDLTPPLSILSYNKL